MALHHDAGDVGLDRSDAVRSVLERLRLGQAHVHVSGPPGHGKREVVSALQRELAERAVVVRLNDGTARTGRRPIERIIECLGLACGGRVPHDWNAGWAEVIGRLKAVDGERRVLIVEGADHLFPEDEAVTWSADLLETADVVTISLAPLALIFPAISAAEADRRTIRLHAFPRPDAGSDYDDVEETEERWNAQDRKAFRAESAAWFDRYLAAREGAAALRDKLWAIFQLKHEQGRDEIWDGHPFLNVLLLQRMLDARLSNDKVGHVLETFRSELPTFGSGPFASRLLPQPPDSEYGVAPIVAEEIAGAAIARARAVPLTGRQGEWLKASGLAWPRPGEAEVDWTRAASLITPEPDGEEGRETLVRWFQTMALTARQIRRSRAEQDLQNDAAFRGALDDVQAVFCEQGEEIGTRLGTRVEHAYSRVVIPDQMYSFRLSFLDEQHDKPDRKDRKVEPKRAHFDLYVFETKDEGTEYWRHHIRILSILGRQRHPSLIEFRRGGELRPDTNSDGLAARMFIEIDHQPDRLPANNLQKLVETLDQSYGHDRERDRPNPVFEEIVRLAEALDLVHAQGILHRSLDFSALAIDRSLPDSPSLVLTGFEFSANLRSELVKRREADFAYYRQSVWNLACQSPDLVSSRKNAIDPSTDIYAFGALAIMLATGLPAADVLTAAAERLPVQPVQQSATETARMGDALREASAILQRDLVRPERWPEGEHVSRFRALLQSCLAREWPTMEDLAPRLRECQDEYQRSFRRQSDVLHVSYAPKTMGEMLKKLKLIPEEKNLDDPAGRAWLQTQIQERINASNWMHYREGGFPRHGSDEAERTRREAKFVFAGPSVVFFASFFREASGSEQEKKCLWLAYAMHRSEIMLPDPDDPDQYHQRATTEEIPWVPKPARVEVITRDQIAGLAPDPSWEGTVDELERRARLDEWGRLGREAATVWRLHRDIQLAQEAIRNFPVNLERDSGDEAGIYTMQLDEDAFRFLNENGRYSFLRSTILEKTNLRAFFADTLQAAAESDAIGSDRFLIYPRMKARRQSARGIAASVVLPVMDDKVRISVEAERQEVPRHARMVWIDSFGTTVATDRQTVAIDRLERRSWLMDFIVTPRDCGRMSRPVSRTCGNILVEAPVERRDALIDRIGIVMSSDPLHAVQGPPGTGKTTLISAAVVEVLQARDGSRMLVTSQSHAATDNVLLSVDGALRRIAEQEAEDGRFDSAIIRLFSDSTRENVDSEVRRRFSVNAQVRAAQERMRRTCRKFGTVSGDLGEAVRYLGRAAETGYLETRFKIERSSPLVFSTTGAAMTSINHLKRGAIGYDYVLIDEAAKAWAVDLVQPLALADRAVLVGDQNQLPPHGEQEMDQLLQNAQRRRRESREETVPPDLDYLLDRSTGSGENDSPFDRMKSWLRIFHRLFEKCPPEAQSESNRKRIPLTQSLDVQFRSVPAIGSLVANTFYRDTIRIANAGPDPNPGWRLEIQLAETDARFAPAIVWIDTSALRHTKYFSATARLGALRNSGEAELLARVLRTLRLDRVSLDRCDDRRDPAERLRILSPYKAQVNTLFRVFRALDIDLSIGPSELGRLFQTVDGSQGSEADIVALSLCRRFAPPADGERSSQRGAGAEEALKRQLRGHLGFLQMPERLNVMMSRARHQILLVGDYGFYRRGANLMDAWRKEAEGADVSPSFWSDLLNAFESFDPARHLSGEGLEQPVILPAHAIRGAVE